MSEERKKLEAIRDGLLLAIARLYLRERHADVSYTLHMRLISRMVRNSTLTEIAIGEGIKGLNDEKPSDALEIAIAIRYYREALRASAVGCGVCLKGMWTSQRKSGRFLSQRRTTIYLNPCAALSEWS